MDNGLLMLSQIDRKYSAYLPSIDIHDVPHIEYYGFTSWCNTKRALERYENLKIYEIDEKHIKPLKKFTNFIVKHLRNIILEKTKQSLRCALDRTKEGEKIHDCALGDILSFAVRV